MRHIVPIVLLCLLTIATASCKKAKLRSQLKELMNSTIVLPEKIVCVEDGEIFPMPDSIRNIAKLVVYVDSSECTTCRISHIGMFVSGLILFLITRTWSTSSSYKELKYSRNEKTNYNKSYQTLNHYSFLSGRELQGHFGK